MKTNKNKGKPHLSGSKREINKTFEKSSNPFPVVGVGASAGGLDAFKKLLNAIPEDSGMAYVLVQHLHPGKESMLSEILQKVTSVPVLEIVDHIRLEPNHIYVIPSNKMLIVNDGKFELGPRSAEKMKPSLPIDVFFASLAEVHQEHSIGVVLSGTASDGTRGLKAIKEHGGITFAQSEDSAAYDGMPHSAIQAGVVDFILPPEEIPQKILEIAKITNGNGVGEENSPSSPVPQKEEDVFRQILTLLRLRKGIDFTYYKQTTIRRRILRRIALNKLEDPSGYLNYLRENKTEQDILFQDLLIPVTSFFRDSKSFDNLCETVFPQLIKSKNPEGSIRIWIAGCSTGQEVYSIAICLKEYLGNQQERVQIFATDISEPAIAKARAGIYAKGEVDDLSPQRLKEFFNKTNGSYQVHKSIRDMCVFAVHNFLKDPPFGKMDFISCRNVLIYMEPYLQKKALTTFHYALNPKGFLLLGKSETVSGVPELFGSEVKHDKIFSRKDVPGRVLPIATLNAEQNFRNTNAHAVSEPDKPLRTDFQKAADDLMLSKYTPAGVVVNEAFDIVHFRGKTANYLEQLPGKPSHNLLKLAKGGLGFELRNILHKAKKEKAPVIRENIPLHVNLPTGQAGGSQSHITIEAQPLPNIIEPYYLVLFHEDVRRESSNVKEETSYVKGETSKGKRSKLTSPGSRLTDEEVSNLKSNVSRLEKELAQAREDMRSITEDQEAVNEELQSANEELLSGSEELQSLNEELETGKEDFQSTNEELTVVNQEMVSLNEAVTEARDYAEAIVFTVREPLLVLDKNLRIKTANEAFYKTFQANEAETEGKLIYDLGNRQWNIPELRKLLENMLPQKESFFDFEVEHIFHTIGKRCMLLNAREIVREKGEEKLILLAIEDVTEKKDAEKQKSLLSTIVESSADAIISKTLDSIVTSWNKGAEQIFGYTAQEAIGKHISMLIPPELQQEEDMVISNIKKGKSVFHYETVRRAKDGSRIDVSLTVSPIKNKEEKIIGASKVARDITHTKELIKKVEENTKQLQKLFNESPAAIAVLEGADLKFVIANKPYQIMTGRTENHLLGKTLRQTFPEFEGQGVYEMYDKIYEAGETFTFAEFPAVLNKEGKGMVQGFFNFVAQPIKNAEGNVNAIMVTAYEITEQVEARKKVEESQSRYHNMIYSSTNAIAILSGEEMIVEVANDAIIDIWGKGPNVIGKPYLEILPELVEQGIGEMLNGVYTKGIPYHATEFPVYLNRHGNRELHYYDFVFQPQRNATAQIEGVTIIAYEVTSQAIFNKKIAENERLYKAVTNNTPDLVYVFDLNYRFTYANSALLTMWGKTYDEAVGKGLRENGYEEWHAQMHEREIDTIVVTKKPIRGTVSFPHALLGERIYDYIFTPVINEAGEVEAVAGTTRDISEIKQAEGAIKESEENFRQLAELMPEKISTADAAGNITYYNESWLEYTGYRFEELKAWGWNKIIHPNDVEELTKRWMHSIATGDDFEMEVRLLQKNGDYNWHLSRSAAMKDESGKIIKWIAATTEIQEQRKQREELEKAVKERTQELVRANEDLKKMNQELESFTYVSSHDLQEPLRKIQTFSARIMEKEYRVLSDAGKDYFQRMSNAAKRMQALIEDLLDYSHAINSGRELKKTDLNKIVAEVKEELAETILEKEAVIEAGQLCEAPINPSQFRQVMNNLISNTLKFSKPGVPPHMIISSETGQGSHFAVEELTPEKIYCRISFSDNGIGFKPEYKDKIFEVFQRLHGKEEYAGTGIGLAIVKKIIDNHNGHITATSEVNKGARFDIYLPE